jgi:hypothetical protein
LVAAPLPITCEEPHGQKLRAFRKKSSASAGLLDSHLAQTVRIRRSRSGWLAWVPSQGAGKKAARSSRPWSRKGMSLQKKTQGLAEDKISE